jgi:hypothetical protein
MQGRKMMNKTIRQWLEKLEFDFENGKILFQETDEDSSPGWGTPTQAYYISKNNPILDKEFYAGHGGPACPRFIAEDSKQIIFPHQYDGATGPTQVWKNLDKYLCIENETPYPGG